MIAHPQVQQASIRRHYELATVFYRLLWGEHIHHGLWTADESPRQAQRALTVALAAAAGIQPGDRVLDIGCGMGGSTIYLAREFDCQMTGITLSRIQATWGAWSARLRGVGRRTTFRRQDAEKAEFPAESFDVLWSIECTEHLFDKPAFFKRAANWLRPGGRLAVCAWLAGNRLDDAGKELVYRVCEGFFCPSLGSSEDYKSWFEAAGLRVDQSVEWTERVLRTWEICERRVERSGIRRVARAFGKDAVLFLDRFETILQAYRTRAMQYGCFTATKPE